MSRLVNLIGQVFGRLTVVSRNGSCGGHACWLCRCFCGNEKTVIAGHLKSGHTTSCGCVRREVASQRASQATTHAMSKSSEFNIWVRMKQRCHNPKSAAFENYGARGIRVCDRWRYSFELFFADMGTRPSSAHSLDRIDNNGNYEPSNCRWATAREQARNSRTAIRITYKGESRLLIEWAEDLGVEPATLRERMRRGWSSTRVIEQPVRKRR